MELEDAKTFLSLLRGAEVTGQILFLFHGIEYCFGPNPSNYANPPIVVLVKRGRFFSRILCNGNLGLAEAFMDDDFEMKEGTLHDFLRILLESRLQRRLSKDAGIRSALRVLATRITNFIRGRVENVRRHYDLGMELFEAFLDPTMTYSCGYVFSPDDTLEQLQVNKVDRICKKLRLRQGECLLDIGCGFGGLLIHAAKHYGIAGAGITLSHDQFERARVNVGAAALSDQVQIRLEDYRDVNEKYDKIVSVGMMEHVHRADYEYFFRKLAAALKPKGIGLLHTVGCNSFRNEHDPFIQKYIFPGSAQPRLSEIANGLEHNGLMIIDVENIIRHYAYTALRWLENFKTNQGRLNGRYDKCFLRMWEYYLSCAIAAAWASESAVYQVLFTNDHAIELPLHRV